jgi:signal transduction histidine kinase
MVTLASRLRYQSIAARLFISACFWSVLILLLAGLILSTIYRTTAERAFDERLQVYLTDIVSDLAAPGDIERKDIGTLGDPRFELPLSGWYWQVGRVGGSPRELRTSKSLFGGQLAGLDSLGVKAGIGELRKGYLTGPDERLLRVIERVIDLGEDGRFLVAVGAPAEEIETVIRQFIASLSVTFTLLGLALVVSTLLQVKFGLEPLMRLRNAIAGVRRGDAVHIAGEYPRDVAPLADELNLLLDANREILERARTHVGNLAHALKTPLSVIINEAEGADGPLAEKMREQAGVMRDQINYYLDRARAAALAGTLGAVTEAGPVIDGLIRALGRIYSSRGLAISSSVPDGARFRGERQDFEDMVGNLADNACKWAKSSVTVTVETAVATLPSVIRIIVDDDGPGMPPEARAEAVERGRRLDESKPGSGLGLSIVADLAELYGGQLDFADSPGGGLRAILRLPSV